MSDPTRDKQGEGATHPRGPEGIAHPRAAGDDEDVEGHSLRPRGGATRGE
jgi:hypothetical protein